MITVDYPPGSSDAVHRHDAHAFVYVLDGSIVMQVKGGPIWVVFLKDKGAPVLVPAQ